MTFDFNSIQEIRLSSGSHSSPNEGLCMMELVSWFAGEKHSDNPECACPVLGAYGIQLNDRMPDDVRDRLLKPLVPQIVGTRDKDSEQKRAEFLAMWAVNKVLPVILRARGLNSHACEKASTLSEAKSAANAANAAANAADTASAVPAANAANAAYAAANAAYAAYAAYDAADAAAYAANAAANAAAYAEQIWTTAVEGLRQAIKLGRHEGLMIDNLFHERREKLRGLECANGR